MSLRPKSTRKRFWIVEDRQWNHPVRLSNRSPLWKRVLKSANWTQSLYRSRWWGTVRIARISIRHCRNFRRVGLTVSVEQMSSSWRKVWRILGLMGIRKVISMLIRHSNRRMTRTLLWNLGSIWQSWVNISTISFRLSTSMQNRLIKWAMSLN